MDETEADKDFVRLRSSADSRLDATELIGAVGGGTMTSGMAFSGKATSATGLASSTTTWACIFGALAVAPDTLNPAVIPLGVLGMKRGLGLTLPNNFDVLRSLSDERRSEEVTECKSEVDEYPDGE